MPRRDDYDYDDNDRQRDDDYDDYEREDYEDHPRQSNAAATRDVFAARIFMMIIGVGFLAAIAECGLRSQRSRR